MRLHAECVWRASVKLRMIHRMKTHGTESDRPVVLVVDDDRGTRLLLRRLLEQEGYGVAEADDGRQALDAFARLRPDIVLMDGNMPVMDGFAAAAQLRTCAGGEQTPILMITSLDDNKSVDRAFAVGASDYVTKPLHLAVLRQRMRQLLQARRAEQVLRDSEQQFRAVFEAAPIGMAIVDQAGRLERVNRAFCIMLGYGEDELVCRTQRSIVHPKDLEHENQLAAHVMAGSIPSYTLEQRYLKKSHDILWVDLRALALPDQHGTVTCRLVMIEDITSRKRAELLEEERRRIAYELHDDVAQVAASAHQHLQSYAYRFRPRRPEARRELDHVVDLGQRVVRETRRIIAGLRPAALDDFGLATALRMQVETLQAEGWDITFDDSFGPGRLPGAYETALYRVAQEALTNVRKHAGTTNVRLTLGVQDRMIRLEIQDWGTGFQHVDDANGATPGHCIGLRGMEDRIDLLGGQLAIQSAPGTGTIVVAQAPLPTNDVEGDRS